MSSAAHRDAVSTLAEKATPYFTENQVKWRNKSVSQARLALAIDQIVVHMREKGVDMATMNGLTAYRDEDGIHVTIELGTLPLVADSAGAGGTGGTSGTGGHRAAR